jgi:Peptidase family M23
MNDRYRPYVSPKPTRPFQRSSGYEPRTNPVTHKEEFHAGVDYRAPRGTPIPAQTPGEVVYSGFNEGYGNTVIVKTTNGYGLYAHMDEPAQVRMGDQIWPGDIIGHVGSTGEFTTGNHLHYSTIKPLSKEDKEALKRSGGTGRIGFPVNKAHTEDPDTFDTAIHYPNETLAAGRAMFGPNDTNDALTFGSGRGPLISASPLHQFGLAQPDRGTSFAERFGDWQPGSSDGQANAPRGLPGMIEEYLQQQNQRGAGLPQAAAPGTPPAPKIPDDDAGSFADRFGDRSSIRRLSSRWD